MQTTVVAVVAVVGVAMWLIRLPDIGNQTVRSKPVDDSILATHDHTAYWRTQSTMFGAKGIGELTLP